MEICDNLRAQSAPDATCRNFSASRTSYGFRLLEHLSKRADAEFFTRFLECFIQLPPVNQLVVQSQVSNYFVSRLTLMEQTCAAVLQTVFWRNSCQATESPHTKQIQAAWPTSLQRLRRARATVAHTAGPRDTATSICAIC